jgi:enoyl-CoA hydratase/carnithine racemase
VETGHEPCETPSTPKVAQVAGSLDIPVLIGMDGHVLGQGLELALASDIRIATPESYFGFHEINAGLIPSQGGTQRLPRLVGKAKALEMILTGEVVDAYAGQQIGLVHRILKRDDLASGTMALAREMATKSPTSLRYTKEAINKGMDLTLEQGLRLEADLYYLIHTTQDRVEGITAYREKRKPEFTGG